MTSALLAAAALAASVAGPVAAADSCVWVHGRLSVWNGSPAVRLWPVGSHRMLGVHTPDGSAEGPGLLPPAAQALLDAGGSERTAVWGDFRVCPMAPERPGRMRPVYISAASHLRAAPR